jgi:hypothetical protein
MPVSTTQPHPAMTLSQQGRGVGSGADGMLPFVASAGHGRMARERQPAREIVPDRCAKAASGDVIHARIAIVSDPHLNKNFRSEADKPRVWVILCRSGFRTGESRATRGFTGPSCGRAPSFEQSWRSAIDAGVNLPLIAPATPIWRSGRIVCTRKAARGLAAGSSPSSR